MKYLSLRNIIYSLSLFVFSLISIPAFADTTYGASDPLSTSPLVTSGGLGTSSDIPTDTSTAGSALSKREQLVSTGIMIVQKSATLSGLIILVATFLRITRYANASGTQNRPSIASIYVFAISGIMLFSYNSTLGTFITTISGQSGDGVCYVVEAPNTNVKLNSLSNCWSDASSEISGALATSVNKISGNSDAMTEFSDNVKIGVGLLQMIGFMFFCFSVHSLVEVGKGSARHGYFKPSVMLIASSLIVDLPHTAEIILSTLKSVGVTISA